MRGVELFNLSSRPCPSRSPALNVRRSLTVEILEEVRMKEAPTRCRRPRACTWEEIATVNEELSPGFFDKSVLILRPSVE